MTRIYLMEISIAELPVSECLTGNHAITMP